MGKYVKEEVAKAVIGSTAVSDKFIAKSVPDLKNHESETTVAIFH